MMNNRNKMRAFCIILVAAFVLAGCVGSAPRVADISSQARGSKPVRTLKTGGTAATVNPAEAAKIVNREEENRLRIDNNGDFELVDTPFGYIKRSVKKPTDSLTPALSQKPVVHHTAGVSTQPATPLKAVLQAERTEEPSAEQGGITFNFDNADIYEVIRTISDILEINYIIDPGVRGTVTIRTTKELSREEIFPVFRQILEASGLMIVEEGSVHKIVSSKDASRMPVALRVEGDIREVPPSQQVVIQIVPLKFITAQEMTKLLTPFVSSTGTIIADVPSNMLLVVDKGINILKVLKLVDVFDINLLEKINHRFYFFTNIDAEEATKTLKEIVGSYPSIGKDKMNLVAISRLNAVLAISSQVDLLERLDAFAAQLDIPSEDMGPRIYVYFVRNGAADQLGTLLGSIFGKKGTTSKKSNKKEVTHTNPLAIGAEKAKEPEKAEAGVSAGTLVREEVAGTATSVRGEVTITPDEVRNALIIEATPRDYKVIQGILDRLDVLPRQVLIEATVAEITLGKGYEMGVEWTFKNAPWVETGSLSASIGAAGLSYAIGLTEKWQAALSALQENKKVNILSSPHLLASDNKEASIDISTEIPVASTSYNYTDSDSDVLETNIQYRDTGVILKVTPHINESGLVTMEISQEVSEQSSNVSVGGSDYPSFYKRSVSTTLTVKHGQTLVIGGLISETKSDAMSGVPCLIDVPLMRYLFGKDKMEGSKTEMIVMITPRVIANLEDVDAVTDEFKGKISQVKERLEKRGENTFDRSPLF